MFLTRLCIICLICGLGAAAHAQTKVAYVDIDRVTQNAKPIDAIMNDVKGEIEGYQEQIATKRKQIQALEAELKRTEGVLSKEEQDKKRKEALRLRNELDEVDFKAQKKMREIEEVVFEPMLKKVVFAIEDVAKEKKVDVVLRGEAVIYGVKASDITEDVIAKLDSGKVADRETTESDEATERLKKQETERGKSPGSGAVDSILPEVPEASRAPETTPAARTTPRAEKTPANASVPTIVKPKRQ